MSPPNSSEWTIEVDESVPDERPYVTGAVVRDVDLDEKPSSPSSNCRRNSTRRWGASARRAIGIHDLTMLRGPPRREGNPTIRYVGVEPDETGSCRSIPIRR